MGSMTGSVTVWGGGRKDHLPIFAEKAIRWYRTRHALDHTTIKATIHMMEEDSDGQWGSCNIEFNDKTGKDTYMIDVYGNQSLREFISTVMHEMIHVKQWETGCWEDDGEAEAELYQYLLADEFWKSEECC